MWSLSIESPVDRLDRLVFLRTIRLTEDGMAWYCHVCHALQPVEPFEPEHEWFDRVVDQMLQHAPHE